MGTFANPPRSFVLEVERPRWGVEVARHPQYTEGVADSTVRGVSAQETPALRTLPIRCAYSRGLVRYAAFYGRV